MKYLTKKGSFLLLFLAYPTHGQIDFFWTLYEEEKGPESLDNFDKNLIEMVPLASPAYFHWGCNAVINLGIKSRQQELHMTGKV